MESETKQFYNRKLYDTNILYLATYLYKKDIQKLKELNFNSDTIKVYDDDKFLIDYKEVRNEKDKEVKRLITKNAYKKFIRSIENLNQLQIKLNSKDTKQNEKHFILNEIKKENLFIKNSIVNEKIIYFLKTLKPNMMKTSRFAIQINNHLITLKKSIYNNLYSSNPFNKFNDTITKNLFNGYDVDKISLSLETDCLNKQINNVIKTTLNN